MCVRGRLTLLGPVVHGSLNEWHHSEVNQDNVINIREPYWMFAFIFCRQSFPGTGIDILPVPGMFLFW